MIITINGTSFATVKNIPDDDLCALRRVFRHSVCCEVSGGNATIDIPAEHIVWSISDGLPLLAKDSEGEATEEEQETKAEKHHAG